MSALDTVVSRWFLSQYWFLPIIWFIPEKWPFNSHGLAKLRKSKS